MTVEMIEKDGVSYRIMIGFGRKQRARYLLYSCLPDSIKRIQAAGGQVEESDLRKLTADEVLDYNATLNPRLVKLVLESASDWDKSKMNVDEYVDSSLSEAAGNEITVRVKAILAESELSDADKKKQ
jgi:uncharacterized protein YqiB (DUF1249 family)